MTSLILAAPTLAGAAALFVLGATAVPQDDDPGALVTRLTAAAERAAEGADSLVARSRLRPHPSARSP